MYRVTITSDGAHGRLLDRTKQAASVMLPAARRFGEYVAREARRRAPKGRTRAGAGLRGSLNHFEPAHDTTVLATDKVYGRIQNFGGTITAGTGKLAAKALAIPLNDEARRLLDSLGASQSLRVAKLRLVKLPTGTFLIGTQTRTRERRNSKGEIKQSVKHGYAVFVLKRSVTLRANPAPHGYAPRMSEPAVRDEMVRIVRRYLTTGRA